MTSLGQEILDWAVPVIVRAAPLNGIRMHVAAVPCGRTWGGMTDTSDLSIQVRRALDHVSVCAECAAAVLAGVKL